ncbi:DUF7518 family protein [Candidatus Halobonum tyrrellensis]|uniref:Smc operon protein n=1 Tax=Candidatus Halobonum tyrrellensis G22 TaxID=1324957 RepID=V4HHT7_9EURY|nr:hypothetical protein [Candidatus Halobonum tyrrellensis]ESP87474.1 hypothetical protein K933_13968 [Candidatus Halobonum tyrrellensis G22]
MGNRVEDLETQVAQLQAAVDGLTEELVETKERLRQLESATDLEPSTETESAHAEFVANDPADGGDDADDAASDADAADATASDEANPAESEEGADDGDEETESGSDDIIVA